ncbi:MAG: hypothetical protein WB820_01805, partial [Rhodoplanes sp.]
GLSLALAYRSVPFTSPWDENAPCGVAGRIRGGALAASETAWQIAATERILMIIDDAWREQDLRPFLRYGRAASIDLRAIPRNQRDFGSKVYLFGAATPKQKAPAESGRFP